MTDIDERTDLAREVAELRAEVANLRAAIAPLLEQRADDGAYFDTAVRTLRD